MVLRIISMVFNADYVTEWQGALLRIAVASARLKVVVRGRWTALGFVHCKYHPLPFD